MRSLAIFFLGFATGVMLLTVALWSSGSLRSVPVLSASKAPAVPTQVETPAPAPTPAPEADRIVPPALHLALPIAGVDPYKLEDTFDAMRDGHKHNALDIPAPRGTPVLAVAEGNVAKLFTSKPGGITVYQFDNTQTYCFYYAHLDRYAAGLKENTLLRKGDVLGYVGSTGNAVAEAPHLHFEVSKLGPDKKWWEGTPLDPLPLLR